MNDLSKLPNLQSLFILGDFLDAWLGDELLLTTPSTHWLYPVIMALQRLPCTIYVMRGNRDFMLTQAFCDLFAGKLIDEPFYCYHKGHTLRLEHGDKLCTDDVAYQRYRRVVRNPCVHWALLQAPTAVKVHIKDSILAKTSSKPARQKATNVDVNTMAVKDALSTCDTLIHGHTHRPQAHQHAKQWRYVLGDWRSIDGQVHAVIGVLSDELLLCSFEWRKH